jgi:putative thioredoxin
VDVKNFDEEVIEGSKTKPVVVDFWAPWCGPCRVLGPTLEKLEAESDGAWRLAKLNTDENPVVASRYRISSIPAVKLFVDGNVASEFIGALPEPRVRDWLDQNLPSQTKKQLQEAQAAFESGDADAAAGVVDEVLQHEPADPEALALKARILAFTDPAQAISLARQASAAKASLYQQSQAVEAVAGLMAVASTPERLPEGPARPDYAGALQSLAAGDVDLAVTRFIDTLRKDKRYNDHAARKAVVAIFTVLGDRHPIPQKHRRAFEMAVF